MKGPVIAIIIGGGAGAIGQNSGNFMLNVEKRRSIVRCALRDIIECLGLESAAF